MAVVCGDHQPIQIVVPVGHYLAPELQGYSYYQASDFINSSRLFNKGFGQEGYFKAANKVTLTTGFNVAGGSKFRAWNAPCGVGIPENENQEIVETPDVCEE